MPDEPSEVGDPMVHEIVDPRARIEVRLRYSLNLLEGVLLGLFVKRRCARAPANLPRGS